VITERPFSLDWKNLMMLDEQHSEELRALRNLERTVRAYSLTAHMIPAYRRQEMLAAALREVVNARKSAIRKSKCVPLR
jgi:hypothetical protein